MAKRLEGAATTPTATPSPPPPDVVAAELRAIRRELELLRREQTRLAEAVERAHPQAEQPAKVGGPKKPGPKKTGAE